MKLPGLVFKLGVVNVDNIEHEVNKLTEQQWIEWDLRQKRYKVHAATETYPFLFSEYGEQPKFFNSDTSIWNSVKFIIQKLEGFYNRRAGSAVLVKLKATRNIRPHTDGGWFVNTHRVHIPIVTHPDIVFLLEGKKVHLERGVIYEINNLVEHGVFNPSSVDRVHLMVDLLPNQVLNPGVLKSPLESIGYESLEIKELV